jgi:hypothetical protein
MFWLLALVFIKLIASFVFAQQSPLYGYDVNTYGRSASNPAVTCHDIYVVNPTLSSGAGYWIQPGTQPAFQVYCDFTNGAGWTLIESASLANIAPQAAPFQHFARNNPSNEDSPNWTSYRLNLNRMNDLIAKTLRYRATCNAHNGVTSLMTNDYVVIKLATHGLITSYVTLHYFNLIKKLDLQAVV